jgi:hypothetical protein
MPFEINKPIIDKTLTDFSIRRGMGEPGPAQILAPIVNVQSKTGNYAEYEGVRNNPDNLQLKRAPGQKVAEGTRGGRKIKSFDAEDRARRDKLPVEFSEQFDSLSMEAQIEELDILAADNQHQIVTQHEKDVHSMLWAANEAGFNAIYGADRVNTPSVKWDASGATIGENVANMRTRLIKESGTGNNRSGELILVMTNTVANKIKYSPNNDIAERIKYVQAGATSDAALADYFKVDRVIVPEFIFDKANKGQEREVDFLWEGEHVGLFYIDPSQSRLKQTLASTFAAQSVAGIPFMGVRTWFDDKDFMSYFAQTHAWYDPKLVDAACGQILRNVLT